MPANSPGAQLELLGLTKRYDDVPVVDGVTLAVHPGEFVTLLGPSGSGKTTTLNMIAGFIAPNEGAINLDGKSVQHLPPHKRGIGMVFQNYALFPHMTVSENVAFPLRQRRLGKTEIRQRVEEVLALVHLADFAHRYPRQLSGGQQQRIAVARAIAFHPRLLLMDEPLGALDKKLRELLQLELKDIHQRVRSTFIYVTHDQEEAIVLSDRIAIFSHGRIEQVGTPQELYERPATLFVASFLGETNAFPGTVAGAGAIRTGGEQQLELKTRANGALAAGRQATLMVRPEHLEIRQRAAEVRVGENAVTGVIRRIVYLGATRRVEVELSSESACVVREPAHRPLVGTEGEHVLVTWDVDDGVLLPKESTPPTAETTNGYEPMP